MKILLCQSYKISSQSGSDLHGKKRILVDNELPHDKSYGIKCIIIVTVSVQHGSSYLIFIKDLSLFQIENLLELLRMNIVNLYLKPALLPGDRPQSNISVMIVK